jgi:competence protein ComEA
MIVLVPGWSGLYQLRCAMKKLMVLIAGLISPVLLWAGPINVNTADAEAISRELLGVGLTKAQAIVEYRAKNGDFAAPEDLLNVKGIGQSILEKNRSDILVAD